MNRKSCPICSELSNQCLPCNSYVVDGERIYYNEIKDFGATTEHELQFIEQIHKHSTTAFFHKGKLYIPSRQGRSVPLAIGLQWDVWLIQQAKIDQLKAQLNNMEQCYIGVKKERDELQGLINTASVHAEQCCRLGGSLVRETLRGEYEN